MFERLGAQGKNVSFTFEGRAVEAREGDTVAAALLAAAALALQRRA